MKKYELTTNSITVGGQKLYRIRALKSFYCNGKNVQYGDLGGFVQSAKNLSQDGECWIFDDAKVYGNAEVYGNAAIEKNAEVYGFAEVYGEATVTDNAMVYEYAEVYDEGIISDNAKIYGNAEVYGGAEVYGDSDIHGRAEICGDTHIFGFVEISKECKISDDCKYLYMTCVGLSHSDITFYVNKDNKVMVTYEPVDVPEFDGKTYEGPISGLKKILSKLKFTNPLVYHEYKKLFKFAKYHFRINKSDN